jgi:hypothetical protein
VSADRVADALERIADALERIATTPSGALPPRRKGQRRVRRAPAHEAGPVDELAAERARRALERAGLG